MKRGRCKSQEPRATEREKWDKDERTRQNGSTSVSIFYFKGLNGCKNPQKGYQAGFEMSISLRRILMGCRCCRLRGSRKKRSETLGRGWRARGTHLFRIQSLPSESHKSRRCIKVVKRQAMIVGNAVRWWRREGESFYEALVGLCQRWHRPCRPEASQGTKRAQNW
ncbi:hypothetical protein BJX99DRAFT_102553 [Aspergillus californicus]